MFVFTVSFKIKMQFIQFVSFKIFKSCFLNWVWGYNIVFQTNLMKKKGSLFLAFFRTLLIKFPVENQINSFLVYRFT